MRLRLSLMVLAVASCARLPEGVLFECEPDGGCAPGLVCSPIMGERYCVVPDAGAAGGASAGGVAGGSSAGGAAGGASAGGAAGGSSAGGAAGGSSGGSSGGAAGGSSGGGSAGGSSGGAAGGSSGGAAGGSSGGGSAGGSSAGGSAGGSSAGGSAGGSSAGGSAGGSSAGGSAGGSSGGTAGGSSGGSAGGASAGGSAGGASAGGSAGGTPIANSVLFFNSRFVAITAYRFATSPGQPSVATVREPADGGSSILESWSPDLVSQPATRVLPWATEVRATQIASNLNGTTAIGGRTSSSLVARIVNPDSAFATPPFSNWLLETPLPSTRLVRLRVLANGTGLVNPIVAVTDGTQPTQVNIRRASDNPQPPTLFASTPLTTAVGDDLLELPSSMLGFTGRCDSLCTLGTLFENTNVLGRFGMIPFLATGDGFQLPTSFVSITNGVTPSFDGAAPIRLATDGNAFLYLVGQKALGVLHIERRLLSNFTVANSFTSTGRLTAVDAIRSPVGNTVLVLATVEGPGVTIFGRPIPYTNGAGTQGNVVLLRIDLGGQPLTVTTWDLPGDQRAVGFVHSNNPGFVAENRVIIIGNQGNDAFIWSVLHPP